MASDEVIRRKKERFLRALVEAGGNLTKASELSKIARSDHYDWKKSDPDYLEAYQEASDVAVDRLEDEATRRAYEGTEKPVYQGGNLVGYIQEYSDTLMIFLLKAKRPGKYRERFEYSGPDGAPLQTQVTVNLVKADPTDKS